jgi:uncharacterized surface protein with fasciclin (FAS1) repeats
MHRTLKAETTRPAGANILQQQARFDAFVNEFNTERPHEALDMKAPADLYAPSSKAFAGLTCTTRSTTATFSSPTAVASACIARGSTSRS